MSILSIHCDYRIKANKAGLSALIDTATAALENASDELFVQDFEAQTHSLQVGLCDNEITE